MVKSKTKLVNFHLFELSLSIMRLHEVMAEKENGNYFDSTLSLPKYAHGESSRGTTHAGCVGHPGESHLDLIRVTPSSCGGQTPSYVLPGGGMSSWYGTTLWLVLSWLPLIAAIDSALVRTDLCWPLISGSRWRRCGPSSW